jgi:hypothetical protein
VSQVHHPLRDLHPKIVRRGPRTATNNVRDSLILGGILVIVRMSKINVTTLFDPRNRPSGGFGEVFQDQILLESFLYLRFGELENPLRKFI